MEIKIRSWLNLIVFVILQLHWIYLFNKNFYVYLILSFGIGCCMAITFKEAISIKKL